LLPHFLIRKIFMGVKGRIVEIVRKEVENLGYIFVDLEYRKAGRNWQLAVFADREGGITIKDCELISRQLGYELDKYPDLLRHSYDLEVSSPGLDRPMRTENDMRRALNRNVSIKLYSPVENYRIWKGKLMSVGNGKVIFEDEKGHSRVFDSDNISEAKLEVKI
ncbi:MAG: ribosome maturation factor RimP, partial [Elusimicrobia bacterium]|nr:ribosome maturation factor RimP [Elusimicrobiota bacterium]